MLESASVFNWRTHIVFAIPAYLSAALFESERYGGDPLLWFWVATLGFAVTAFVIEFLSKPFRRSSKRRWYLALGILVVAGFLRGSTVLFLGSSFGLFTLDSSEVLYRLVGGPLFLLAAYSTINAVVESYLSFRRDLVSLEKDRQELDRLRSGYRADVEAATQRQRDRVNQLLAPAMWELQKLFEKTPAQVDLQQALVRLQSITNDIVRPASHELASTEILARASRPNFMSSNRLVFPKRVLLRGTFSVWFFTVTFFTVAINSQVVSASSPLGLITALVTASPSILALAIVLGPLGSKKVKPAAAALLHGVIGISMGVLGGYLSIALGIASTDALIWQASSYLFLAIQLTYAYGLLNAGWARTLEEHFETLTAMEFLNAKLRQQIWLSQKSLALELHGSVQSRLTALSKTIQKMDPTDSKEVTQLIIEIRESLNKVENRDYLDGKQFNDLLGELQLLWEGSVDISFDIGQDAANLLEEDEGLARCTFEILREAVTNSVKHGDATEVVFRAAASETGLALEVWNNGAKVEVGSSFAGNKLLAQLSSSHSLTNTEDGVLLRAEVTSTLEGAV